MVERVARCKTRVTMVDEDSLLPWIEWQGEVREHG